MEREIEMPIGGNGEEEKGNGLLLCVAEKTQVYSLKKAKKSIKNCNLCHES